MATQQLPNSLPPGWESDYDGTSERWFFIHRPTGFSQFFFPKAGDEHTRLAELAQPQPTNASLTIKMEAMTISGNTNTTASNQQLAPLSQPPQAAPQEQPAPAQQPVPQPAPSPQLQQGPQGSPVARTMSQSVQRKAIPNRRDSVQSQISMKSSQSGQSVSQPAQQAQQVYNPQSTPQIVQNVQQTTQAQQYQQPVQYHQFVSNGQIQYQPVQSVPVLPGQPGQTPVPQSPAYSPQFFGTLNQAPQQFVQPQQMQQPQQHPNVQVQPQYVTTSPQSGAVMQNTADGQRRFSTIPVLHQVQNGQVINSPPLAQQQIQGTRHSSIPLNNFQPQPVMVPGQQVQQFQGQPVQNGQVQYAPQMTQPVSTQVQQSPVRYVQQNPTTQPAHLPPPAPGMQWVLVQPGTQSKSVQSPAQLAQPSQPATNTNQSPNFSVQMQQYGGGASVGPQRPGLVKSFSSGTRKALESSKGFVKKNPVKSMALVGSLGLVAEACGVNVISDAVAGSKVYANMQAAKNRKKLPNTPQQPGIQQPAAQQQTVQQPVIQQPVMQQPVTQQPVMQQQTVQQPMMQQPQGALQVSNPIPNGNVRGIQHAPQAHGQPHQQHYAAPGHNSQQGFIPQMVQQMVHRHPHQNQQQQYDAQQNVYQSTDPSSQFYQAQNGQPQYVTQNGQPIDPSNQMYQTQNPQQQYVVQQNPPVQYYQPVDTSQQQFQQQSPVYIIQDGSGQNSQSGGLLNFATDGYNMLPNGQGNQSQPQSPSASTPDNLQLQQQLPTPTTSPFDASSQQFAVPSPSAFDPSSQLQQQSPGGTTSPFDPTQIQPQFSSPTAPIFDPSTQVQQQQVFIDPSSTFNSQQFTNDLVAQSILNASIQENNSNITSPSPVQYVPDLTGQSILNASIQDDNSYINPPSPIVETSGYDLLAAQEEVDDAQAAAFDDMDSAIF